MTIRGHAVALRAPVTVLFTLIIGIAADLELYTMIFVVMIKVLAVVCELTY
jgi:hypothetical protein